MGLRLCRIYMERERGRAREAETPVPGTWEIPAPKGAVWLLQGEAAAAVPGVGGGVVGGVGYVWLGHVE